VADLSGAAAGAPVDGVARSPLAAAAGRDIAFFWPQLALGGAAAIALIITLPLVTPIPGIDSGIFLYVGRQMLHGALPYRDLWDNKPPGIYLIDALGLALSHRSRWGLCLVEWLSLWAATTMGFAALRKVFGAQAAFCASFCWLAAFARSLQGGNFPEEFVLPLQFASLIVFGRLAVSGVRFGDGVSLGILAAIALMLKPNAIGLWIAIGMWSVVSSWRHRNWLPSIVMGIGAVSGACVTLAIVGFFFHHKRALGALIDQAIHYNLIYSSQTTWADRLRCVAAEFRYAAPSGLSLIVLGAWAAALYVMAFQRTRLRTVAVDFVALAAIALPIETTLASTTGDIYFHHFIVPLPCWAILIAFAAWMMTSDDAPGRSQQWIFGRLQPAPALVAITLVAWLAAESATWKAARDPDGARTALLHYVTANSTSDDFVLTWGLTAALDFAAGRREPSRFFHEFPLSTPGYTDSGKVALLMDDLRLHPPLLIIDSSAQSGRLPPLDAAARAQWIKADPSWRTQLQDQMAPLFAFVQDDYRESADQPSAPWKVYRRDHRE
jgi:hypothetical protein